MTIKEVAELFVADSGPITAIFMAAITILQIAPVKINPWSAIFHWLGSQLNKEVMDAIDNVEKRLDKHIMDSEQAELTARRTSILDFSSSAIRGVNYHKEKFDFMMNECDNYEKYCTENEIKNGVAEASIAEIRRIYHEHLRNDDFLVERVHSTSGGES